MDDTQRIPFLELRGVLEEVQTRMDLEDLLEKYLKIVWGCIFLLGLGTDEVEGAGLRGLGLEVLPQLHELLFGCLGGLRVACAANEKESREVVR